MFKTVTAKLANMRKPQRFVVQRDTDGIYLIQSDKSIGQFDGKGRGILNTTGSYFHHLMASLGAKAYLFPAEFVQECQELFVMPGETIGLGLVYGGLSTVGKPDYDPFKAYRTYLSFENRWVSHDKNKMKQGDLLWDSSVKAYVPYTDQNLEIGCYSRRNKEDFEKYVADMIEAEVEVAAHDV